MTIKNCLKTVLFVLVFSFSLSTIGAQEILSWLTTTPLPLNMAGNVGFTANGYVYSIGGSGTLSGSVADTYRAQFLSNGELSSWTSISNLPKRLILHSIAKKDDNYVYVLGGFLDGIDGVVSNVDTVFKANINSDGSLSNWESLTQLPKKLSLASSGTFGNKIYVGGGDTGTDYSPSTSIREIYMNDINSDGTIGPNWTVAGLLPEKMLGFGMMEINGYMYIFGGRRETGVSNKVQRALIDPDTGYIGDWEDMPSLPKQEWRAGITRSGNMIIVAGGHNFSESFLSSVYFATINSDGTISSWQTGPSLPNVNCCSPLVSWNNYLYFLGGHNGGYTNQVLTTHINEPSPSTPPEPTPTPVTKVIFAPGFGGSWNASAFANCTLDTNPENWSLASYAESVYNPILNAISDSGWNLKQFYYDWRAPILTNSSQLGNTINSILGTDEKIKIVGHSMGGLVAAGYLNNDKGTKTDSLLTVGSPLKGVPISYPAWSGGEIWEDNFITKVALNLYLRHCGGISSNRTVIQTQIPSLNNLLPVFNYLKKGKNMVLWNSMVAKNTWPPITFDNNFWGVKFGTLTGTGFSTLSQIPVKDPSSKDIKAGNWLDGKPSGKIYSYDGDGTVLLESAKYDNGHNITINQNHQGLVNSIEGMTEILKFIGTNSSSQYIAQSNNEPKSSLIIIGYPGNFWITDGTGKTTKDKNGMIAFNNPKSGDYKLNILPSNTNTLFVVAQFLPNGEVFYKEYKFSNLLPKNKILKFDLNNPKEDILN